MPEAYPRVPPKHRPKRQIEVTPNRVLCSFNIVVPSPLSAREGQGANKGRVFCGMEGENVNDVDGAKGWDGSWVSLRLI